MIAAGVAVGLLFGERTSVLQAVADGYIKLLQMTVLPYVTVSIIGGFGALSGEQARALATRVRDDDWIMVHDAARPCFSSADLQLLKRELATHPVGGLLAVPLADTLKRGLEAHNASCTGSSMRIARAMLMVEPPSIDGNELTDKGYINQRAGLERRAGLVERLYAAHPGEDVIILN